MRLHLVTLSIGVCVAAATAQSDAAAPERRRARIAAQLCYPIGGLCTSCAASRRSAEEAGGVGIALRRAAPP
eukprot:gene6862-18109_t